MTKRFLLFIVIIILGIGCKKSSFLNYSGFIIGSSYDIVPIEDINLKSQDIVNKAFLSSVLIATKLNSKKIKFCSGNLVQSDQIKAYSSSFIITNYHCFVEVSENENMPNFDKLLDEACYNTNVYFGVSKDNTENIIKLTCDPKTFRFNKDGDLAFFQTKEPIPPQHQPLSIANFERLNNFINRDAVIVHYPSAQLDNMIMTSKFGRLPSAKFTLNDCKTLQVFPKNLWDKFHSLRHSVEHSCDIIEGSSGASLIDIKTAAAIGVNWGGIALVSDDKQYVVNGAIRSDYIIAALNNNIEHLKVKEEQEAPETYIGTTKVKKPLIRCGTCGITIKKDGWTITFIFFILPLLPFLIFKKFKY